MTNAPETRKTHVTRLIGTNKSGEVLQDMWIDVERIDIAKSTTQFIENDWQGHQRKFRWADDPLSDDYDPSGNPAREERIIKVCSPDEANVDDPEEWIPVRAIKSLKAVGGGGNVDWQGTQDRFRTGIDEDPDPTTRIVEVRRIVHYDTNIDDAAQAAFDSDPSLTAYVVPGDQYVRDDSTKDTDQFVEHEVVTYFKEGTNENNPNSPDYVSGVHRGRQVKLLNQYLIDESDDPTNEVVGASGINPPYRLDPYQNIINVQLSTRVYVVITSTFDDYAIPNPDSSVKLIDKRKRVVGPPFGSTCTLLECSSNAGADFATLKSSLVGGPGGEGGGQGSVVINVMVYPKTDEVRKNWFDYALKFQGIGTSNDHVVEAGPFLWIAYFSAYNPCVVKFKIRSKPHLKGTPPKGTIVEAYPTTGTHDGLGGQNEPVKVLGYFIGFYRTDKKGTGTVFAGGATQTAAPSDWKPDVVFIDAGLTPFFSKGLLFGKDPPLIDADIPSTP